MQQDSDETEFEEVLGFPFTQRLQTELNIMSLLAPQGIQAEAAQIFASHEIPALKDFCDSLRGAQIKTQITFLPDAGAWNESDQIESALLSSQIIQAIADLLIGKST